MIYDEMMMNYVVNGRFLVPLDKIFYFLMQIS